MKPAEFDYVAVESAGAAVAALAATDGARLIAGGQALVPLMSRRAARPSLLVDIGRVAELRGIARDGEFARVGAATPLREVESSDLVGRLAPALAAAAGLVGPHHVRARATVGGSLGHADPAAEIPAALVACDAHARVVGPRGERVVPVAELVVGRHRTTLARDELVTAVGVPVAEHAVGGAFREFAPRRGDLPLVGVAVVVAADGAGRCADARVVVAGAAERPLVASGAAAGLIGQSALTPALTVAVAAAVDVGGADAYRAELAQVLTARALVAAWRSAGLASERAA